MLVPSATTATCKTELAKLFCVRCLRAGSLKKTARVRGGSPGSTRRLEPSALEGAEVTFYNVDSRETESFFFRNDGVISSEDEKRLEDMFRCKRTGHRRSVERGLITILARLGAKYPGRVFELVSAHRAAPQQFISLVTLACG